MQIAHINPARYYVHGDRSDDKDLEKFWCVSCELFMEAGHFDTIKKAVFAYGCNSMERFIESATAWREESKLNKNFHYRPRGAPNLFERRRSLKYPIPKGVNKFDDIITELSNAGAN